LAGDQQTTGGWGRSDRRTQKEISGKKWKSNVRLVRGNKELERPGHFPEKNTMGRWVLAMLEPVLLTSFEGVDEGLP
jgi:hypothetical protein